MNHSTAREEEFWVYESIIFVDIGFVLTFDPRYDKHNKTYYKDELTCVAELILSLCV